MAQQQSQTSAAKSLPQAGDTFHCQSCGMELQITKACKCGEEGCPRLECCGQPLAKK